MCRHYSSKIHPNFTRLLPELNQDSFPQRHIGTNDFEVCRMLREIGFEDKKSFMDAVIPAQIRARRSWCFPDAVSEAEIKEMFIEIGCMNERIKAYMGGGFYGTITPSVIQRNLLENPMWYTPYTPYQAEISQGRLESLFNFQTMVSELTGMPISNASLLDEGSAAAEAMSLLYNSQKRTKNVFAVSSKCFPSTLSVVKLRAEGLGIIVKVVQDTLVDLDGAFGILIQYPDRHGRISLEIDLINMARGHGIPIAVATDLMALTLIKEPGSNGFDFDVSIGSSQRFGSAIGFGGPHAAFFACKEKYKRQVPGRIVGLSRDRLGRPAYRLSLQTREQHIRRDTATSNICTSQALLANVAAMFAVYHGPGGLKQIAKRIHKAAVILADVAERLGYKLIHRNFFDTIQLTHTEHIIEDALKTAAAKKIAILRPEQQTIQISLDETVTDQNIQDLCEVLAGQTDEIRDNIEETYVEEAITSKETTSCGLGIPDDLSRKSNFLSQHVFNQYHSEASLTRYMHELATKDISLVNGMMPLGSCTMKLNACSELLALSMPDFTNLHPQVPERSAKGYEFLSTELKEMLSEITGLPCVCLQPNSGAQGEYLALMLIRRATGAQRNLCLIPKSAHGTNAASASMAGFHVVTLDCTAFGEIDLNQLEIYLKGNINKVGVLMATYPSTFGIFDESTLKAMEMVKLAGGMVYIDGANLNAMVGYCRLADMNIDACHLNLHKTFCIPHGGGGPGSGPICM